MSVETIQVPKWVAAAVFGSILSVIVAVVWVGIEMKTELAVIREKLDSMEKTSASAYSRSDAVKDFQLRDERDKFLQSQIDELRSRTSPR